MRRVYDTGKIIQRCTIIPMLKNTFAIPQFAETSRVTGSRFGGVQVYREDEAQNLQVISSGLYSQKPTIALSTLSCKKYTGLMYCTDELDVDSSAFGTWASLAYTTELKFVLEQDIISGTGAGQAQGIINAQATIAIPKALGHASGTVNGQDVLAMIAAQWAPSKPTSVWLYNPDLLPTLASLTVSVGTGGGELSLWQFGNNDSRVDSLCGIPAFASENCLPPGTAGDIILADFTRYAVGIRKAEQATTESLKGPMEDQFIISDVSIHLEFITDQNVFRWVLRADGMVIDISPITSANASQPTSPFVTLAARP
jgi:HK97 family phage major capsid protein